MRHALVRTRRTKVAKDGGAEPAGRGGDEGDADASALRVERHQRGVTAARGDDDAEAAKHVGRERPCAGEGDSAVSARFQRDSNAWRPPLTCQRLQPGADAQLRQPAHARLPARLADVVVRQQELRAAAVSCSRVRAAPLLRAPVPQGLPAAWRRRRAPPRVGSPTARGFWLQSRGGGSARCKLRCVSPRQRTCFRADTTHADHQRRGIGQPARAVVPQGVSLASVNCAAGHGVRSGAQSAAARAQGADHATTEREGRRSLKLELLFTKHDASPRRVLHTVDRTPHCRVRSLLLTASRVFRLRRSFPAPWRSTRRWRRPR